jgi:hypothetical protein
MRLWHDLRVAARRLAKDRECAAFVVLTLALGIAANTAVFTIPNAAFLRDLPFEAADRVCSQASDRIAQRQTSRIGRSPCGVFEDLFRLSRCSQLRNSTTG